MATLAQTTLASKPEPASVTTRAITTVAPKPKIAVIH